MDDNELQVVIEEMVEGASPTEPEAPAGAAARARLTPCAQAAAAATSVVVPSQVLVDVHAEQQQQQQQLRMTGVDVSHGPGEVNNIVSLPANVGHAGNLASLPGNIGHADSIAVLSANVEHADNITSLPGNVKHAADSITLLPGNIEHVESNASAHANVGHTADKIASLPAIGGHTDSIVPNFRQADSIVLVPANVAHVGGVNTAGERVLDPPPAAAADLLTRGLDEANLQLLACDPSLVAQYDTACAAAHPGGQPPDACSVPESAADKPPQKRPTSLNIRPREFAQATAPSSEASSASSVEEVLETSTSEGAKQPVLGTDTAEPGSPSLQNVLAAISPEQRRLGKLRPYWVPDNEAPNCMNCHTRFTLTKRRHHCRACGRVMCATCCHVKSKLQYMENKEGRVCQDCYNTMNRVLALEHMNTPPRTLPNPNNPAEYCSTVPPLEQAQAAANQPPPTVLVPVGVLKTEGSTKRPGERKQVMFSDGIRPGGDLTELDGGSDHRPLRRLAGHGRVQKRVVSPITPPGDNSPRQGVPKRIIQTIAGTGNNRLQSLIPDGPNQLPPVIIPTDTEDIMIEQNPKHERMLSIIKDESSEPVTFLINKNLNVLVKMFTLDCCVNRQCWCFASNGMCTVGQDELVIVLEALPDEEIIPCDVLLHLNSIYQDASQGKRVHHMGHSILETPFLESRDHCGFLYMRPTFQCLNKLIVPEAPYLFAVLLQKWEIPWAKVFPIRLMLRLGAEFRYYPCPLVSVRFRKPVYCEIGHTIMNILADLRNYKYQLPQLKGMTIHMEDKKTYINFPRNRYNEIIKVVNNSNDHVMALGANFSKEADSHLVCIQNDDGNYQTQAINIQNKPRKVTGASFVVFNGALKPASGLTAKSSIVEDGLMVQIVPEDMATLKQLLREMKGYTIGCGAIAASQPDEVVEIRWVEDDKDVNIGVKSQIDGRLMDGVTSLRIHNSTDYLGDSRVIRWTEVFLLQVPDGSSRRGDPLDLSRLAETLARACCVALTEHLDMLKDATMSRLGLRVTIDTEKVGYEIGSNGMTLSRDYMNDLDTQLIPVIHQAASQNQDGPITLELIFHILE
ncbi:PREDICTED: zinc finger FYVE domain-containing protein 9-like isoform X2 [Priapulus caudatus]|uniref:Zinc finger FYVE domain-containing protein 9-like isoform X2 n=1 Tax=Priapulus caudatus TaxID=37621 RepID=A0ABM1DRF6_PRICU|nr:PREDICTED: zinc finger FYVE domain-containing protein 9-like isoform X2 [Priapulus caudatus]